MQYARDRVRHTGFNEFHFVVGLEFVEPEFVVDNLVGIVGQVDGIRYAVECGAIVGNRYADIVVFG